MSISHSAEKRKAPAEMFTLAMPWYCLSSGPAILQLTFYHTLNYSVGLDWHTVCPQCQRTQDHRGAKMHFSVLCISGDVKCCHPYLILKMNT